MGKVLNSKLGGKGNSKPVSPPAFQTQDKQETGKRSTSSRINRRTR